MNLNKMNLSFYGRIFYALQNDHLWTELDVSQPKDLMTMDLRYESEYVISIENITMLNIECEILNEITFGELYDAVYELAKKSDYYNHINYDNNAANLLLYFNENVHPGTEILRDIGVRTFHKIIHWEFLFNADTKYDDYLKFTNELLIAVGLSRDDYVLEYADINYINILLFNTNDSVVNTK